MHEVLFPSVFFIYTRFALHILRNFVFISREDRHKIFIDIQEL